MNDVPVLPRLTKIACWTMYTPHGHKLSFPGRLMASWTRAPWTIINLTL
jgi:hypothetical protein